MAGGAALIVLFLLVICTVFLCRRHRKKRVKTDEEIPLKKQLPDSKPVKITSNKDGKRQRDKERKAQELQEVGKQVLLCGGGH